MNISQDYSDLRCQKNKLIADVMFRSIILLSDMLDGTIQLSDGVIGC